MNISKRRRMIDALTEGVNKSFQGSIDKTHKEYDGYIKQSLGNGKYNVNVTGVIYTLSTIDDSSLALGKKVKVAVPDNDWDKAYILTGSGGTTSSGGEANVQSDWIVTDTTSDAYIQNKPTIPSKVSDLTNDSGFITSIPSEYVTDTELNAKGYLTQHQDISGKVDKIIGKGLSTNDYTTAEKDKLSSLSPHPATHSADMITESDTRKWVSPAEKSSWDNKETPTNAQAKADAALNSAKSYADIKVATLINQAPETLDTLKELSDALGNDPNFATTISAEIGDKLSKTGLGDDVTATVVQATDRINLTSGEKLSVLFGKIAKWFSDLKALAFKDKVSKSDLDTSLSSEIDGKVDAVIGKNLSSNDLTSDLKSQYDSAYSHSQAPHAPTDAEKNVITTVKKNGVAVTVDLGRSVDIPVPTKTSELTNDSGFITSIPSEYVTDTELTAKGYLTEHQDISGKADTTNVLAKNNTTAYTPTDLYHPATKKYVDDALVGSGSGDMLKIVYDTDNDGVVDNAKMLDGQTLTAIQDKITASGKTAELAGVTGLNEALAKKANAANGYYSGNIDELMSSGVWVCSNASGTLPSNSWFMLAVFPGGTGSAIQIASLAFDTRMTEIKARHHDGVGWSKWYALATSDDIAKYLPLTGGTMTGDINFADAPNIARVSGNQDGLFFITNDGYLFFSGDGRILPIRIVIHNNATNQDYKIYGEHNKDSMPFLPLTGGTLTGRINLSDPYGTPTTTSVIQWNSATYLRNLVDDNNYRDIYIDTNNEVYFIMMTNGVSKINKLYGEHNITSSASEPASALPNGYIHMVY